MRKAIKPTVRKDGVSFVDRDHFANGQPIKGWRCEKCGHTYTESAWADHEDKNKVSTHVTGGFYGPNGNGYTYYCPRCEGSVKMLGKDTYSALNTFFGFR